MPPSVSYSILIRPYIVSRSKQRLFSIIATSKFEFIKQKIGLYIIEFLSLLHKLVYIKEKRKTPAWRHFFLPGVEFEVWGLIKTARILVFFCHEKLTPALRCFNQVHIRYSRVSNRRRAFGINRGWKKFQNLINGGDGIRMSWVKWNIFEKLISEEGVYFVPGSRISSAHGSWEDSQKKRNFLKNGPRF